MASGFAKRLGVTSRFRMHFPDLENTPVELGEPEVTQGAGVTHLCYQVNR